MTKKYIKRKICSKTFIPSLVVIVTALLLTLLPNVFENPVYKQFKRSKAEVVAVNNETLNNAGVVVYGEQKCTVRILSGKYKGEVREGINIMTGSLGRDKEFAAGDRALVLLAADKDSQIYRVTMVDHYRVNLLAVLAFAFVVLLVVLAGWIGVRALLSFVFTVLCIWKVLIPLFLRGVNPILCGLSVTSVLTVVIIILVYGFDKRSASAISGSLLGTFLTASLAILFVRLLKIHGAVMDYSESLLYSGFDLNLTEIFIASIFLASSGAMMDIAVDITSAVNEVIEANPSTGRIAAIRAGMNVGRAALGTMTTTLLLAYSGSYVALFMVFVAQGTP